jgi:hypothetical protein
MLLSFAAGAHNVLARFEITRPGPPDRRRLDLAVLVSGK